MKIPKFFFFRSRFLPVCQNQYFPPDQKDTIACVALVGQEPEFLQLYIQSQVPSSIVQYSCTYSLWYLAVQFSQLYIQSQVPSSTVQYSCTYNLRYLAAVQFSQLYIQSQVPSSAVQYSCTYSL